MNRVGGALKQISKLKYISNGTRSTIVSIRQYSTKKEDDIKNKYSDLLEGMDEYVIDQRKLEIVTEKEVEEAVDIDKEIANINLKDLKLRRFEDNYEDYELMKKMHVDIQNAFEMDITTQDLIKEVKLKKEAELTGSKFKSHRLSYQSLSNSKTQYIADQLVKFKDQFEKPLVDIYNEVNYKNNLMYRSKKAKERLMSRILKRKNSKAKLSNLERHYIDLIQIRNALDLESKSLYQYGDEDDAWTRIAERTLIEDPDNLARVYMTDAYEDFGHATEINEEYLNLISASPFNFANPNSYASMVNVLNHIEADYHNQRTLAELPQKLSDAYIDAEENGRIVLDEVGNPSSIQFENIEEFKSLFSETDDLVRDHTIEDLNLKIKLVRETGTKSIVNSRDTYELLNLGRVSIENGSPVQTPEEVLHLIPDDDEMDNEDFDPNAPEEDENTPAEGQEENELQEKEDESEEIEDEYEDGYDPNDLLSNNPRLDAELEIEFPSNEIYRADPSVEKIVVKDNIVVDNVVSGGEGGVVETPLTTSTTDTTTTTTEEGGEVKLNNENKESIIIQTSEFNENDIKNQEDGNEVTDLTEDETTGLENLYIEMADDEDFNDIDLDHNLGAYETDEEENEILAAEEEYEFDEDTRGKAISQPDLNLLSTRIAIYEEKILDQVAKRFANSEINEQTATEALDMLFENYKEQNILNPDVIEHERNSIIEVMGDVAIPSSIYYEYDATNRDLVDKDIEFKMHLKDTDLIRVLTNQLNDSGLLKQEKFLKVSKVNVPLTKEEVESDPVNFPDFAKDFLNDGEEFIFNTQPKPETFNPILANVFKVPETISGDEIYDERRLYINFKPIVSDNGVIQVPKVSKKYKIVGRTERPFLESADHWEMGAPIDIMKWRMHGDIDEAEYGDPKPPVIVQEGNDDEEEFLDEDEMDEDERDISKDLIDLSDDVDQDDNYLSENTELYRYLQEGGAEEWFRPEKISEADVQLLERGMSWFPREHITTYPYQFLTSKSPTDQTKEDQWNNRKVILKVNVAAFNLPKVTEDRLAQLSGKRFNKEKRVLMLVANNLKTVEENKYQCKRLFKDLLYEANLADPNFIPTKPNQFPQRDSNSNVSSFIPSQAAKSQSSFSLFRLYGFPNSSIQFAKNHSLFNLINEKLN